MNHDTGSLTTSDGLQLHTRHWWPDDEARASILLVHGIGEHSGRYAYPAAHLLLHQIELFSYDQRGHGLSEGPRVQIESFEEYVEDLALAHAWAQRKARDRPLFLMGHSLGGLVVAHYVVDRRPALPGLILSSPALQIPPDLSPLLQKASGVLSRFVPQLRTISLNLDHISRDPVVRDAYANDPLVDHGGVRARMGHEVLQATSQVREHPDAFSMPLYLFHGTADQITDPDGSKWLASEAPSGDITLRLFEGLYHETLNEPERDEVLEALSGWVLDHADGQLKQSEVG